MKCMPCAVDKHDECVVENGRSTNPTPCSCSDEHAPKKPAVRVVKRRKR